MPNAQRKRFYSVRLPHPFTRRHQIGLRVCATTKRLLVALADARSMSVSEYLARLVSDHLAAVTGARR